MKSRREQKKRKHFDPATVIIIKQVLMGVFILSFVSILIVAVWYLTRLESFTITNINIYEDTTIDEGLVRDKVEQELEGTYFRLIPKRFSFWYPEEKILKAVEDVERIKNVRIEKISGSDLSITFDEYFPDTLWCGNEDPTLCYFLNKTGYSFAKAPQLSGESVIRYYKLGEEPDRGVSPFETEDYKNTKQFIALLQETGWFVTSVEIDAVRDVFYTLTEGSELKANLQDGPVEPFEYLQALRQSKEFEHLQPGNFQYVDLRFGSKVYVNEEKKGADAGGEIATSSEAEISSGE